MEKEFKVELETLDPTGIVIDSKKFSMMIQDDNESLHTYRLIIYIGESIYHINRKGEIIDKIK